MEGCLSKVSFLLIIICLMRKPTCEPHLLRERNVVMCPCIKVYRLKNFVFLWLRPKYGGTLVYLTLPLIHNLCQRIAPTFKQHASVACTSSRPLFASRRCRRKILSMQYERLEAEISDEQSLVFSCLTLSAFSPMEQLIDLKSLDVNRSRSTRQGSF
jgi:hypothetical protein